VSQQLTAGRPGHAAAAASFVCFALLAPWLLLCRLMVEAQPPDSWAPLGWLLAFVAGAGALSAVGVAFGIAAAARRSGWGVLALALNAPVLLWALWVALH
jgi:hypothetical protein